MIIACLLDCFADNKLKTQNFHLESNAHNIEYKEDFPQRKAIFGSTLTHVFFHDIRIIEAASKLLKSIGDQAMNRQFTFCLKLDKA